MIEDSTGMAVQTGDRIEMHPGTDLWMRGARFGDVLYAPTNADYVVVELDRLPGKQVKVGNRACTVVKG